MEGGRERPRKSGIFNFNKVFFLGLFSSVITAALGYAFRLLILYYVDYDIISYSYNLSELIVSLSYFCSLGGIRFVMNEYLKDTICLMSTPGGGSSSNPYGSTLPAPSNSASGTNTTNSISSTTNSAPTNSGSSNSVTTSNDLGRVTVDKNYPSKNCFTGHYTDKEWRVVRLFVPIDSDRLHGTEGKHYLGNWLCGFRQNYFEINEIDSTFGRRNPKFYHVGVTNERDHAKITEYVNSVNNNSSKEHVRHVPLDEKLIDALLRNN